MATSQMYCLGLTDGEDKNGKPVLSQDKTESMPSSTTDRPIGGLGLQFPIPPTEPRNPEVRKIPFWTPQQMARKDNQNVQKVFDKRNVNEMASLHISIDFGGPKFRQEKGT